MIYWSDTTRRKVEQCYQGILDAWSTPHTAHRLPTSQGETFALSAGDPSSPAVVLLPGAMATSAMWLRTIDAMVRDFHLIAADLIGDAGFSAPSRPKLASDSPARIASCVPQAANRPR